MTLGGSVVSISFTFSPPNGLSLKLIRSEEHTSELQSHLNLVCRLLLEKKKKKKQLLTSRMTKLPALLKRISNRFLLLTRLNPALFITPLRSLYSRITISLHMSLHAASR